MSAIFYFEYCFEHRHRRVYFCTAISDRCAMLGRYQCPKVKEGNFEFKIILFIMSESTKTYVFPENGTNNGGVDPNMLLAMMGNNGGGFGNGSWIWVIFLFFLYGWRGGNGLFGSGAEGVNNTLNNDFGRSMLLEAINGNRNAISNLSTQLGCTEGQIQTAINGVQSSIQNVGNQVGLSGQQVINAIQSGNMSLASQLSQCCCDNKLAICNQTN